MGGRKQSVAHHIVDALVDHNVEWVFIMPGGACSPLLLALAERPQLKTVVVRHEANAGFLAMGSYWSSGRPPAIITTAGPGITNAVTGIGACYDEQVPVIYVAGDVAHAAAGRGALQDSSPEGLDARGILSRVTKRAIRLTRPLSAAVEFRDLIDFALAEARGPVFASLPLDVGACQVQHSVFSHVVTRSTERDLPTIERVAKKLADAQRPLMLLGAGCRTVERTLLTEVADRFNLPVAITPHGKGTFDEAHPRFIGGTGFGGHDSVLEYCAAGLDVLLVCGSRLDDFSTNAWSETFEPSASLVQFAANADYVGRNYPVDIFVRGALTPSLTALAEFAPSPDFAHPFKQGPSALRSPPPESRGLSTAQVVQTISTLAPDDAVFTCDMGEHLASVLHHLDVHTQRRFFTALGFGSMGSGPVSAIGLSMTGDRNVFGFCGDGGFLMSGNEILTAVHLKLAVTLVIFNDARLNMCHHGMHDLYGKGPDLSTPAVDFAALAQSLGAEGILVRTLEQLEQALAKPMQGPRLLDVHIDPDARTLAGQRNAALKQFQAADAPT